ncbi:hypothetical protein BC829DRAFT_420240 [Chytridium lagenaria]|nr:hypothetical protein BC829DRAFT_420240 [Chytridium lagenaria]
MDDNDEHYAESDIEEDNITPTDSASNAESGSLIFNQRKMKSWVWEYFAPDPDTPHVFLCQANHVSGAEGRKCLTRMIKDNTKSTGKYIKHLRSAHRILSPSKRADFKKQSSPLGSGDIRVWAKSDSLKTAIAHAIVKNNWAISACEDEAFTDVSNFATFVKRAAMTQHLDTIHYLDFNLKMHDFVLGLRHVDDNTATNATMAQEIHK